MIEQWQDAIILAGILLIFAAVCLLVVLVTMTAYFEVMTRVQRRRKQHYARLLELAHDAVEGPTKGPICPFTNKRCNDVACQPRGVGCWRRTV
jgi:hypothetical protein